MRFVRGRSSRVLSVAVLIGALLGAALRVGSAPVAEAQMPPRGPLAVAPSEQPIGAVRLPGGSGGAITFPIFGVSAGVEQTGTSGGGGGGSTTHANFSEVAVTKVIDATTPRLWQLAATGQHLMEIEVALCRAGQDCSFAANGDPSANAYLVYTLEDVLVISVDDGGAPVGGILTERVAFSFGQLTVQAGTAPPFCWDVRQVRTC